MITMKKCIQTEVKIHPLIYVLINLLENSHRQPPTRQQQNINKISFTCYSYDHSNSSAKKKNKPNILLRLLLFFVCYSTLLFFFVPMSILLPPSSQLFWFFHSCRGSLHIWKPLNPKCARRGQAAPRHLCCRTRSSSLSISPLSLLSSEPSTTAINRDLLPLAGRQGEESIKRGRRRRNGGRNGWVHQDYKCLGLMAPALIFTHAYFIFTGHDWGRQYF